MSDSPLPLLPWYKRAWGILLIIFLALIVLYALYIAFEVVRAYRSITSGELPLGTQLAQNITRDPRAQAAGAGVFDVATPDDPSVGPRDAQLTIVEFGDFECPFCRDAFPAVRSLMLKYSDRIFFQFRDYPVHEIHEHAQKAHEAAGCAEEQEKFWEYHDKLYTNQGQLDIDNLKRYAVEIGLDTVKFNACLASGRRAAEIQEDYRAGLEAGVQGTPTFFINGYRVGGVIPEKVWEAIIKKAGL